MRETAILIPFKANHRKSRLSKVLNLYQRRRLAELMLMDVLHAFHKARLLPNCHVVSSDGQVLALVRRLGGQTIAETKDNGVNSAVNAGVRELGEGQDFMVVPADLPLLSKDEIVNALALKTSLGCVISPSHSFDGTNMLIFPGETPPALSYDSDSFWNHIRWAAESRLSLAVYCGKGVLSDIDTPEDLRLLSRVGRRIPSVEFAQGAVKKRES